MQKFLERFALLAIITPAATLAAPVGAPFGDAEPVADTNNSVQGGCPIESANGRFLYTASSRDGGEGDLDIWRNERRSPNKPYGEAENLGSPVNSAAADFCPTPLPGGVLFFVSNRALEGACGGADMYVTRWSKASGWADPVNLGCADEGGPNTAGSEFSPSLVEINGEVVLYFSSSLTEPGGGVQDLYRSVLMGDQFGPREPVAELNTGNDDRQPNVSVNGREMVFASDRAGGEGGLDIWLSTRDSVNEPWGEPVNLGPGINTALGESRPSLSRNGQRLLFGRAGEIYVSHR